MEAYIHVVNYYETDMMGFVHHSNYIRWMEEARTDYQKRNGYPYERMEQEGLLSPVTAVQVKYKRSCTFGDTVRIEAQPTEYNGVRLRFCYKMYKQDGTLACEAESEHCFLNREGRPVRVAKVNPAAHAWMAGLVSGEETNNG